MSEIGKIIVIDLSNQDYYIESIGFEKMNLYLGGRGLGARILYDEIKPRIDPFDAENVVIFSIGPLTGTPVPGSNKYVVTTKSPLTGVYLSCISGRGFGPAMRKAGLDVILIRGRSDRPTYLQIWNDEVKFKDATHIWGTTITDTRYMIEKEIGNKFSIACIGPAGENLVRYASIINDRRAAARGGAGAVMGSKFLKAIAVGGDTKYQFEDKNEFIKNVRKAYELLKKDYITSEAFPRYGTVGRLAVMNELDIFPTRNWQSGSFDKVDNLSAETLREKFVVKDVNCPPCPVNCAKISLVKTGEYAGSLSEGPEYETIYAFGSVCFNDNMESIIHADRLCDEYGMDTISTGVSIAFAMECVEKGYLKESDIGLNLHFGNHSVIAQMIKKIAYRDGFGDILADGVKIASSKIGGGAKKFAMHVKGMELPGYDPRGIVSMALVYACSNRGGCHLKGGSTIEKVAISGKYDRFSYEEAPYHVKESMDRRAMMDSAIICNFNFKALNYNILAKLINSIVGTELRGDDLKIIGERIITLERSFNVREGISKKDDTLPWRLFNESIVVGGAERKIDKKKFLKVLEKFYEIYGWDNNGVPTASKLKELNICV